MLPQEMAEKAEATGGSQGRLVLFYHCSFSQFWQGPSSAWACHVCHYHSKLPVRTLPYGTGASADRSGLLSWLDLWLWLEAQELFTGNNLIVMAWASHKISTMGAFCVIWVIVYIGNFVGSLGTAGWFFLAKQYTAGGASVGEAALNIAVAKVNLGFVQALALGILCNTLVCLAIC